MKQLATLLFISLLFAACKKNEPQVDPSVPLAERIPGTWDITEILYSGVAPNPGNPGQSIPFSGEGQSVSGYFSFQSDPNVGVFNVSFIASIDLGLSQPLAIPVNETSDGMWKVDSTDQIVTMWSNDSIYDWHVITNLPNNQTWQARFYLDFGVPYDSIPVDIEASMERK